MHSMVTSLFPAATSDNSDYYDYQIEAGAVGVYQNEDGSYSTNATINGTAEQATGTDISSWVDASDSDARHWDKFLLNIFENEEYAGVLSGLFNQN